MVVLFLLFLHHVIYVYHELYIMDRYTNIYNQNKNREFIHLDAINKIACLGYFGNTER